MSALQLIVNEEAEESNSRPPIDLPSLSQTDLVVDAIGPMFRASLLAEFVQLQVIQHDHTNYINYINHINHINHIYTYYINCVKHIHL